MISLDFRMVLTIILVICAIVSYIAYKTVCKRHRNDPEYQNRMAEARREQEIERQKQEKENEELDAVLMKEDAEYEDE